MSIYIHIPFCRTACSYCDFHFSVNHDKMEDLVAALIQEIELRKNYLDVNGSRPELQTIYFGGGTPSLLQDSQLVRIMDAIRANFVISKDAEITLEANPDDLTPEKLVALKAASINRLSIGVQSFFDSHLELMNRAHNSRMAIDAVTNAAAAGFDNITIDLIYGVPGMSESDWQANMDQAFSLPIQHLSAYSLTVENRTLLDKLIRDGKIEPVKEEEAAIHFEMLMHAAKKRGFMHYEISNFAKPGFISRHNSSYWKNLPYLGIGPSAHSYNGVSRQWNIAANAAYILSIRKGEVPGESELLTMENRYNEYLMTGLRTMWGVDTNEIKSNFGESFVDDFLLRSAEYVSSGDLEQHETKYIISEKGKLIADRIAAYLFR
ncbi:MAG: radical SAM family heme chaperone HemW [Bacteroidetes bacterium]|nr:radical SAM family heme chaperone HemW [Bacteroidota bacterium]